MNVLVVDDDRLTRMTVATILRRSEMLVREASSGPEAFSAFQVDTFDAVVTDYSMRPMNGWELAEQIRAFEAVHARQPRCRLILMTGLDLGFIEQTHSEHGPFDMQFQKPVTGSTLVAAISG